MLKDFLKLLVLVGILLQSSECAKEEEYFQPEQIHIAYGAKPSQMIITWTTLDYVNETVVEYGHEFFEQTATGSAKIFVNKNTDWTNRQITIHSVLLDGLVPGQFYKYHCGSPTYGWSPVFFFTAMPEGTNWSPRFAVYGDMGHVNAQSVSRLQEETMLGKYDAVLHVGDFGYDMVDDEGRVADAFMNQIQDIAAYLPYMTCVGNHENAL